MIEGSDVTGMGMFWVTVALGVGLIAAACWKLLKDLRPGNDEGGS